MITNVNSWNAKEIVSSLCNGCALMVGSNKNVRNVYEVQQNRRILLRFCKPDIQALVFIFLHWIAYFSSATTELETQFLHNFQLGKTKFKNLFLMSICKVDPKQHFLVQQFSFLKHSLSPSSRTSPIETTCQLQVIQGNLQICIQVMYSKPHMLVVQRQRKFSEFKHWKSSRLWGN